ncbi:MAG: hypothetical protein PHG35_03115 [Dehalococcoidales bacterium]|nr:hypothetical protein [Dehalococcoidales bacterium]
METGKSDKKQIKKRRTPLSNEEIIKSLKEQLEMLSKSCERFDRGDELEAKNIAIRLRIIWYNKGQSKGLASQLNLDEEVVDTSFCVPRAIFTDKDTPSDEKRLFTMGGRRVYSPVFDDGPGGTAKVPFFHWWNGNVIKDINKNQFTRKDVILEVADTDGGAHVDSSLVSEYYALTRNETFGVIRVVPTKDPKIFTKISSPSPVAVTLRQIGHETLKTLVPDYNYNGRIFYPGPSLAYFSAHLTPREK